MSLSTEKLRGEFKTRLHALKDVTEKAAKIEVVEPLFEETSHYLEKAIAKKLETLAKDMEDFILRGEYLRSMTESLDDLDRFRETSKNLNDYVEKQDKEALLKHVSQYYSNTLVPLLNLISKLENDYLSLAKQTIAKKEELIGKIEYKLTLLKSEKRRMKLSLWTFNSKKIELISRQIEMLEFRQSILSLTLEHDKLNLAYFNQDHPEAMSEIKSKADAIRFNIRTFEDLIYA